MADETSYPDYIPGAEAILNWFGYWPSFHDHEVIEVCLRRKATSWLKVQAWHQAINPKTGRFDFGKYAIVTFKFEGIVELLLEGFNSQNVLFCLDISRQDNVIQMELSTSYGLTGIISAQSVSIDLEPGSI